MYKNQDVVLANPVLFRVTPLTVDEALTRGVINIADENFQIFFPSPAESVRKAGKISH